MSRTYRKALRVGICYGNNTPFYKARRRHIRNINSQLMKNMMAHMSPDELNDNIYNIVLPKKDDWMEPTDGTYLVLPEMYTPHTKFVSPEYFRKMAERVFKSKSKRRKNK